MTPLSLAGRLGPATLLWSGFTLLLAVAACTSDAEAPRRADMRAASLADVQPSRPRTEAPRRADPRPARAAGRPAATRPDRSQTVFDTVEVSETPPALRPEPSAERRPELLAPPAAPRAPRDAAVAGSCDVRPAEGYCFAYTGGAWTPTAADAHCAAAPGATFRPDPCPTAGRVATCTFRRPSDPAREIVYTTYAPADLDLARLACPGVFAIVEQGNGK